MAFKIQYNKTALQEFKRQLGIRERSLPVLKNKETALRQEIKRLNQEVLRLQREFEFISSYGDKYAAFYSVFPPVLKVKNIEYEQRSIVGIKVPELKQIHFSEIDISWVVNAAWIPSRMNFFRKMIEIKVRLSNAQEKFRILHLARKKTTQKVNLYEKVQIPELESGIGRIKRYLEDKENIEKAAQKIIKKRHDHKLLLQ